MIFLQGEFEHTGTCTDKYCSTLKTSQMIAHAVVLEADVQPFGTFCTKMKVILMYTVDY